ncbi:MAG: hypothetical protein ACRDO1_07430 [Nocardioidaceae bacterium]
MLITNHVLAGAALGLLVEHPGTALAAGLTSHFALDAVPHFGVPREHLMRVAVPDGLVGLATIAVVVRHTPAHRRLPLLAGILGACLPDLDKPGRQFFDRSPFPAWFDHFHGGIQHESTRLLPLEVGAGLALGVLMRRSLRNADRSAASQRGARPTR